MEIVQNCWAMTKFCYLTEQGLPVIWERWYWNPPLPSTELPLPSPQSAPRNSPYSPTIFFHPWFTRVGHSGLHVNGYIEHSMLCIGCSKWRSSGMMFTPSLDLLCMLLPLESTPFLPQTAPALPPSPWNSPNFPLLTHMSQLWPNRRSIGLSHILHPIKRNRPLLTG